MPPQVILDKKENRAILKCIYLLENCLLKPFNMLSILKKSSWLSNFLTFCQFQCNLLGQYIPSKKNFIKWRILVNV